MKKKMQLMELLSRREKTKELEGKVESIIRNILYPDAYDYLMGLEKEEVEVANKIKNMVVNLYLRGIRRIDRITLRLIERKIRGEEPKIFVKRRGEEIMELKSAIKKRIYNE
ncbi:MAG: hypothetical protein J7L50_02025 [Candidatus Odinarchaeota archaeon]|nr:hypothetical protein [Candidatus Odinarchaeota archaeon]